MRCSSGRAPQGRLGLVADRPLGLAPLVVGGVELSGDRRRPGRILGQHQLDAGVGTVEAPGGVQPRSEPEGDVALVDPFRLHPRDRHQGQQAGTGCAANLREPAPDEEPVLAGQRDEVGDRRERDEVEVADPTRLVAGDLALHRLGELGGHRRAAEALERIVADPRMDDRAIGELLAGLVMVGDDHVDPGRADLLDLGHGADPAVDRDQQPGPPLAEVIQRAGAEAVAVAEPVGDQPVAIGAGAAQGGDHDRGRADAVDVVVAVDRDPLPGGDRRGDRLERVLDPLEEPRVVGLLGIEERARRLDGPVSAANERDRDRVGELQVVGDPARLAVVVAPGIVGLPRQSGRGRAHPVRLAPFEDGTGA